MRALPHSFQCVLAKNTGLLTYWAKIPYTSPSPIVKLSVSRYQVPYDNFSEVYFCWQLIILCCPTLLIMGWVPTQWVYHRWVFTLKVTYKTTTFATLWKNIVKLIRYHWRLFRFLWIKIKTSLGKYRNKNWTNVDLRLSINLWLSNSPGKLI